jgi:septal ring factor EnvC (AmiA/AmiB activator)
MRFGFCIMIPYGMREKQELGKNVLEVAAAVVAIAFLVACAYTDAPRLSLATPAARAVREREQNRQSLAELQAATQQLQTRNEALQAELAKMMGLLENTRSGLSRLAESHNSLGSQVATTSARLQQFETAMQQANERLSQFSESAVLQRITKERDEAIAQTKEREDQVRQLTLKLQKVGVYP